MPEYRYDHIHLRSPDPNATAHFFEAMFGAEVKRDVYPPGTLYPGQMRVRMKVGGQTVLIALGVDLTDVIRMVTVNAATMLGLTDELGSLAPGRVADVSVLALRAGKVHPSQSPLLEEQVPDAA